MPDQLKPNHHAVSLDFTEKKNVIKTDCYVRSSYSTQAPQVIALWDTGAMFSAISSNLAIQLCLPIVGKRNIQGVHSNQEANMHLINLILPNNVEIVKVPVAAINIEFDVLIGMDIIGLGDFAICRGQYFSFVYPSFDNPINFVDKGNSVNKKVQSHNKKVQMTNLRGDKGFRPKKKARKK